MREANVHYRQIINGNKIEMHLCSQCADKNGQFTFSPQLNIGNFLWGFPGLAGTDGFAKVGHQEWARCETCGMVFDDFRKTGKLGCANCYSTFRDRLNPILRRLHGNVEHTGKVPGKVSHRIKYSDELEKLKNELADAISKEEYEKAAQLRDRIRSLEDTGNKNGGAI